MWATIVIARFAIPLNLLFNFALGVGLSIAARDRIRSDGAFAVPAFPLVLIYLGLVLWPSTLYLYLAQPAWVWMYTLDPETLPGLLLVPLTVGHQLVVLLGWYVGGRLMLRGATKGALLGTCAMGLAVIIATILTWTRVGMVGTFTEFTDGRALPIMEVKLGYIMVAMVLGVFGAATFLVFELLRDSRRVRAR